MILITPEQLRKIAPELKAEKAKYFAEKLNDICPTFGIDTKKKMQMFVAQAAHESGGFSAKVENMNYTTAAQIKATWPSRFKNELDAQHFVRNPKGLANYVYNGRMGNRPNSDDGWFFRGGGYIGITGRENYTKYQKHLAFDTVENVVEVIRNDDYYALHVSCWIFSEVLGLNVAAERGDLLYCTKRINGGTIGLKNRQKRYDIAREVII
jgi:putative chitinase